MVKTLMRKLGHALISAGAEPAAVEPGRPNPAPPDPGPPSASTDRLAGGSPSAPDPSFERAAQQLLGAGDGTVQAGAVVLIGMDDIRETLGQAWCSVAERAHEVTETVIRRHLGRHDVFTRRDDETYFLCFANLDRDHATTRVERIVEEIKGALVQQLPPATDIKIEREVVELDPQQLDADEHGLVESIGDAIDRIRKNAGAQRRQERQRLLEQAAVRYAPVWSVRKGTVQFFRCLLDDATGRTVVRKLLLLSEGTDGAQVLSDVDGVVLGRAAADLHDLLESGAKAILIIPVGYITLDRKKAREAYLALCKRLPEGYRRFVMFELYGIPPRARPSRVVELLTALKPYCRATVVEKTSDELPVDGLGASGAFAISINLETLETGFDVRGCLLSCARSRLGKLLYGTRTRSAVASAAKAGFDFIAGEAIGAPLDKPRSAYPLNPLAVR